MTKFVGAEYVIACALIELKKKGIDAISVESLCEYGIQMQSYSIEAEVDAVFLTAFPYVEEAIFDFSDYFCVNRNAEGEIKSISIVSDKEVKDLTSRFVGSIPLDILAVMEKVLEQAA